MTTPDPLDNIVLPYGVVAYSVEGDRVIQPGYIKIPEGVNTVQITWDHEFQLDISVSEVASHSARKKISEVPAGTGRRTVVVPGVGVPAGSTRYLSLLCNTAPPAGTQATIQIITMPLQK